MLKNPARSVIDTNVLISAIIFGGNPQKVINLILENKVIAITSTSLISEFLEVLSKKFHFIPTKLYLAEELIKENFIIVHPENSLNIVRDRDDNRVLEAAVMGKCRSFITGDVDLLELKSFQGMKILTPDQFLKR